MENKTYLEKIFPLALFLAVELMFLVAFNFGNFTVLLRVVAFLLALVLVPKLYKELHLSLSKGLFLVIAPLFLYSFITMFAPAYQIANEPYGISNIFMNRPIWHLLFNALGILSFVVLGYFVSKTNVIKPIYVVAAIFGGLTLLLTVSLFATLINYGPFYRLIYANKINFYHGEPYNVSDQSSFLVGFKIITANYKVISNLALLIAAGGAGFLFVNDFKDKKLVALLSVTSGIGVLALIILPDFRALIYLIPALLVGAIIKFKIYQMKHFKKVMYVLLGLTTLGIIVLLFTAFNSFGLADLFANSRIMRRLLLNGYTLRLYAVLRESLNSNFLFGLNYTRNLTTSEIVFPTQNFLFDSIRIDGLFGAIFLALFFVFVGKTLYNYWIKSEHNASLKFMLISFALTMFIRFLLHYPFNIHVYRDEFWQIDNFPFIESQYFVIIAFIAGFAHIDVEKTITMEEAK